ncbi:MAG: ATP-binding cassette subfamily C protein LapB [Candidatus Azotimanducaceae bacterium]|jgi:ATP-binding cassette subfamily C protein LapB
MNNQEIKNSETSNKPKQDALLDALVYLTRYHHKPCTAESLTAGLPLESGKLNPDLFVRAAESAGFLSKHAEIPISEISSLVLPVVLCLKNNSALILLEVRENHAVVLQLGDLQPAEDAKEEIVDLEKLESAYIGRCLYCKPMLSSTEKDVNKQWFWATIKKSKGIYAEVLIASLMINLFALVSPLFIMNVYDRVVPNYAVETLWVLASGVFIVFVFDFVMKSLRGYFIDIAGKRADILLSSKTFAKVMDIKMDQRPPRVGSYANNLQEFDSFREFFTSSTIIAIIDLPFVLLFITLIYGIGGSVAFVPLIAVPLILIICLIIQKPLQSVIEMTFAESAKKHGMLIEALTSLDAIKGARAEGIMQKKWEEFNARLAKLSLRTRILSMGTINLTQFVQQMSTVAVVIIGVYLIMDGLLSVGGLIACTILTGRCLAPMGQVASILTRYHHSIAAFGSINKIMNLPVERPKNKNFLHRRNMEPSITFNNVAFAYPDQKVPALKDIRFTINPGEKVAIIGKMGSGKSTLQRLIMNFYQPSEGNILISGTDIAQLDPTDLRKNISYVPQDISLLSGTIRENIVMSAPQASDEDVLQATKISGLSDFVNRHPEGFDLQVGERGSNLSGGQRQAIALARALIVDCPMLLLDEPTNAMDSTAEFEFKNYLATQAEKTLILITHKSSMLSLADRLIVLNEGQIVADGPRDEVLQSLRGQNNA